MIETEIRAITCPKCDPAFKNPDHVQGIKDALKYLLAGSMCKLCGTELKDLGKVASQDS